MTYKILSVLLAGVIPILMVLYNLFDVTYLLVFDRYYYGIFSGLIDPNLIYCLFALVLSISNNYCRYHSMMILSLSACCILSLIHDKFLTLFGDYLVYNLIILSLTMFSLIMLIVVFVHIAKQIKKHIHKLKLLYYGIQQRIFRCYRRNS